MSRADPPSRIGPYRIIEPIQRRGLSVTYAAEHEAMGRRARVKTLEPAVSLDSSAADDLEREARVLAKLRHPSIPMLFDFVRSERDVWLAFEDAAGFSLSEILARAGALPVEIAVAIAHDLASAVGHAHAEGVVHGDLRPASIELSREGKLRLFGFSAAAIAQEGLTSGDALSRPDYMAPEQVLGDAPTPEADVFALGVLLHEMIAGSKPFVSHGSHEATRGIRSGSPLPLGADVPRSIVRITQRCLEKRPDARFEDGNKVSEALAAVLVELSPQPRSVLIARALARAKLAPEPKTQEAGPARSSLSRSQEAWPALRRNALILLLIVSGGAAIELFLRDRDVATMTHARWNEVASPPGFLRVLASPWAEIVVDGETLDVTPVARPIPVPPGRHYVTFRHPNAPEEKRTIDVVSGHTVLLDVTMRIVREAPDAGLSAETEANESP